MPLARRSLRAFLALATVTVVAAPLAPAQPLDAQQQIRAMQQRRALIQAQQAAAQMQAQGVDPRSFEGKDSTEGVYVRDSALAQEKFALAQKMERLKEWNKSADL